MQRRSFLASMLAACAAPAYVGAGVLVPVRQLLINDNTLFVQDLTLHRYGATRVWQTSEDGKVWINEDIPAEMVKMRNEQFNALLERVRHDMWASS